MLPATSGNAGNVSNSPLRRVLRLEDMPGTGPQCGGAEGVIAMRRFGVIAALGALLSMIGGAGAASPALAAGPGRSRRISRFRRLLAAIVIPGMVIGAVAGGALSAPALADTGARPLHLAVLKPQFTSFTCLNPPSCSLAQSTVVGKATSNLSTGPGSFQAILTIDFSPGGTCNIVDEPAVFTFDNGTILTHSHHEDCATNGLRIDTTFQVTGGTGAFAGASGGGHEFNAFPSPAPVIYNGTISF
jgi:hypothetical protein